MQLAPTKISAFASRLVSGAGSLLAPLHCAVCARGVRSVNSSWGFGLCRSCARGLEPIDGACRRCGASRGPHAEWTSRCPRCHARSSPIQRTASLLRYRGVGRKLLHRLKYGGREDTAVPLGARLAERALHVWGPLDALVVPVPLHWRRRRERGFDQAERLAQGFATRLDLQVVACLRRTRHTPPLFGVKPELRHDLLRGVFALRRGGPRRVRDRTVVLVDDIRTSGGTLEAAAEALRSSGARRVLAAVVAR